MCKVVHPPLNGETIRGGSTPPAPTNMKTKSEKREETRRNRTKMLVKGRAVFNMVRMQFLRAKGLIRENKKK